MVSSELKLITANEWFEGGVCVAYDPARRAIVPSKTGSTLNVFERVETGTDGQQPSPSSRWLTMLPGFPDGSFGFAKVEDLLAKSSIGNTPRLYVEYVGQGESDKPRSYAYSSMERADLVQAQWNDHNISRTVVVTFDYSSLVLLELLRRQQAGQLGTKIEHVLIINGGLFADGHSHPWTTTPLLQTRMGRMGSKMAQRSNMVMDTMLTPLYGKEYRRHRLTKKELHETSKAIRRNKGAHFLSDAAGFVKEHKRQAKRWDLASIYLSHCDPLGITVHVVGSVEDPFEHRQLDLVKQRLGSYYPGIQTQRIPGGHWSTAEQAEALADLIANLVHKNTLKDASKPAWSSL